MAKSTTVVRDEKQSPQPEKAVTKARVADKLAERGQESPGQGNQITGMYTRTVDFLRDVRSEMRKVVTPSRAEVQATTTVVIVTVFIFGVYFWLTDLVFSNAVRQLLHRLGGE